MAQRGRRPAAAQSRDHTAEIEVPGFLPGTDLGPADALTSALGNAYTALDISICSPHAQQAGPDFTRSRLAAKLDYYGPHVPDCLECLWATPPRHVDRCALSQQIHRVQTQLRLG